jgi:hypothetical protein
MRRLVGAGIAALTSTGLLAATSDAAIQSQTGDTCVVNGNGTAYTVVINLPPNAPEQGGFAFGASGVKITNVRISDTAGSGGNLSTQNLPATSAPVTGSFTVVPSNSQHTRAS